MKNTNNVEVSTTKRNEAKIEKAFKMAEKATRKYLMTCSKAASLLKSAGANERDFLACLRLLSGVESEFMGIDADTLTVENLDFGLKLYELEN